MRQKYSDWRGHDKDRPWLALVRYTAKRARPTDWILGASILLIGLLSDLFTGRRDIEGAPTWVSRILIGFLLAGVVVYALVFARRRKPVSSLVKSEDRGPWVPIEVIVSNGPLDSISDLGSAMIEDGRLLCTCERSSFQIQMGEIELLSSNSRDSSLEILVRPTGQRLTILPRNSHPSSSWRTFENEIRLRAGHSARPSLYPPKPQVPQTFRLMGLLVGLTMCRVLISLTSWKASAYLPFSRDLNYALLAILFLLTTLWLTLFMNLKIWRHYRLYDLAKHKTASS